MNNEIIILVFFSSAIAGIATSWHASNNQKNILWGFVVFFTGFLGLILYAISLASD